MGDRTITDSEGVRWTVATTHQSVASREKKPPPATPWIHFRSESGRGFSGPSSKGHQDLTDDELLELLGELRRCR